MRTVIVYATTEGQTRKIARFAAERIMERGQEVEVIDAVECLPEFSLDPYGLAILMASLHMGHYQPAIVDFIRRYHEGLGAIENAFVSVSLVAASSDRDDLEGLETCDRDFFDQTEWTPKHLHHAAGAFRFTKYDFFRRWAMKLIALQRGVKVDMDRDTEYTDWDALSGFIDGLLKAAFHRESNAA